MSQVWVFLGHGGWCEVKVKGHCAVEVFVVTPASQKHFAATIY